MTLDVERWINSDPIDLTTLRDRVVLIEVFQMLCPGCVRSALPQAQRVHRAFDRDELVVLGLHSVFEHHDVQGRPEALAAFVSEYRFTFPIAIDRPIEGRAIPSTMARYGLQGTPSTLLVDRAGRLRHVSLGTLDDIVLGAHLGRLLTEPSPPATSPPPGGPTER